GDGPHYSWGAGLGAANISGGPYHHNVGKIDGVSLGSKDNQLKGADILIPKPSCNLHGPTTVCGGAGVQTYTTTITSGTGVTYAWSLTSNTSGATISGSNTNDTLLVNPGSGGSYTVQLIVTNNSSGKTNTGDP